MEARDDPRRQDASPLDRVRRLRGVTWEWSDPRRRRRDRRPRAIGVIAQEVREVFPEAVITGRDGTLSVDYAGLTAPLIEACKELADRVERLEERLADSQCERVDRRLPPDASR